MNSADTPRASILHRVWRTARWCLIVMLVSVLVARWTNAAESMFYWPSREPYRTPPGYEEVTFTTEDGVTLHAWFMPTPRVDRGSPAPALLHVHGNAGNIADHESFSSFLPSAGMHVLLFDYRCYGRSDDRAPLSRRALAKDTHAALAYLMNRPDVDPQRVGVLGVSLGGAFAIDAVADEPGVKALATVSAFSSWRGVAADASALGWLLVRDGLDLVDSVQRLGDRPYLIMHALADRIVPPRHAQLIYNAAQHAGIQAQLRTYAGGDHNTLVQSNPKARQDLAAFFRAYLVDHQEPQ